MTNLNPINWSQILEFALASVKSSKVRKNLENTNICDSPEQALQKMQDILDAKDICRGEAQFDFSCLDYFELWHSRLQKQAALKAEELKLLRQFVVESESLRHSLSFANNKWCNQIHEKLFDCREILARIDQIITPDASIKTTASPLLQKLYNEKIQLGQNVQKHLDRLVKDYQLESILQDRFVTTREGRWVLPIKNGMQSRFSGIIHDTSQSKMTVFMEPQEVVNTNNKIREIEIHIEDEIARLLKEISDELREHIVDLENNSFLIYEAEEKIAWARLANLCELQKIYFHPSKIQLHNLRNPALLLQGIEAVGNNLELNQQKSIMILSGPNAGGKTIFLKSLGLACHMARCGIPVCAASGSSLPFVTNLFLSVGDPQDLAKGLSSFAGHIKDLNLASKVNGFHNLILIDEICGATDPEEGSALAKAFIEHYAQNSCFALITSHLSALKEAWPSNSNILNACMEYDDYNSMPSYKLISGISGQSLAWKVAAQIGSPQKILDRAKELLSPEYRQRQKNFEEIESIKNELVARTKQLEREIKDASQLKDKYKQLVERFKEERNKWMDRSIKKTENRLDHILEEARQGRLKKMPFEIKAELPQIVKKIKTEIETLEDFTQKLPPGSKVYVPSLGQEAIVQSKASANGEVSILANSMRLSLHWKLLIPAKAQNNSNLSKSLSGKNLGPTQIIHSSSSFQVDLRGKMSQDAIEELERRLDEASLKSIDRIKIIHGHGSGQLRKAVRDYLLKSSYIENWNEDAKDDGVTWATIK